MTADAFFTKYNGKGIDFDGYYGYQCMDLYQQYNKEVVGAPYIPVPAAADVWTKFPTTHYTKIANTPTGVPQKGDVIIWNKNAGGGFGHIAVFKDGDMMQFTSFDQNWNGSKAHFQKHNYTYVTGWLRPKVAQVDKLAQIRQVAFGGDNDADARYKIKQILG